MTEEANRAANVFGEPIATCSTQPMTGFYRDGCCNTGGEDLGLCVTRWKDALAAAMAPPVILAACHLLALEWVTLEELESHAVQ